MLTVCVPTVPSRESMLSRLLWTLAPQVGPQLEVIVASGPGPMGDKVNAMFAAASGTHVTVVDDDDLVTHDYIAQIAPHLDVDFVGHHILWLENGAYKGTITHHAAGDPHWRSLDRGVCVKCPVKVEIARRHSFGNAYTDDRVWAIAVHREIRTAAFVDRHLYIYDHWNAHMLGTEPGDPRASNPQRDVGLWPYDPSLFRWL